LFHVLDVEMQMIAEYLTQVRTEKQKEDALARRNKGRAAATAMLQASGHAGPSAASCIAACHRSF
jgi:hypothetical protein